MGQEVKMARAPARPSARGDLNPAFAKIFWPAYRAYGKSLGLQIIADIASFDIISCEFVAIDLNVEQIL